MSARITNPQTPKTKSPPTTMTESNAPKRGETEGERPSLTPKVLSSVELKGSVENMVNTLTGKNIDSTTLEGLKVSEDVLYAAIVHSRIEARYPGAGQQLLSSLQSEYQANVQHNRRQPLKRAVDHFLHDMVRGRQITNNSKESLMRFAFGKAQLDSSRTTLARAPENQTNAMPLSTGETQLDQAMERVMTNRGGRVVDVNRFNERLAKNRHLTAVQAREQANVLERMFPSVKAPETPAPQVSPPVTANPEAPKPTETDKTGKIPNPNDVQTTAEQFVYRPSSERDGKILFMIPARWRDRAQSARLLTARDEQTIEELKPPTYGDDKRVYFRGEKNGRELSGAGILRVTLIDGSPLDFQIEELSSWQVN